MKNAKNVLELSTPTQKLSFSKFPDGIPRGSLLELSGNKRDTLLNLFLHEQPEISVAWIVQGPPWIEEGTQESILERKVAASFPRIELVDYEDRIAEFNTFTPYETYWALLQTLRSRQFDVIITPNMPEDTDWLKDIRYLAELTGTTVIFVNEQACLDWSMGIVLEAEGLWPGLKKSFSNFGKSRVRLKKAKLQLVDRIS